MRRISYEADGPGRATSVVSRLVLAAVVSGVLAAAVGATTLGWRARRALMQEVVERNQDAASRVAVLLDDRVETSVSKLRLAATRSAVSAIGAQTGSELNVVLKDQPEFDRLVAYAADGRAVAASSPFSVVDVGAVAPRPDLVEATSTRPFAIKLLRGPPAMLELAVSIGGSSGAHAGVLEGLVRLEELTGRTNPGALGAQAVSYVVDREGRVLVHPERARATRRDSIGLRPPRSLATRTVGDGSEAARLFVFAPTTTVPAVVVIEQPLAAVVAPANNTVFDLVVILFAVVFVTTVTASLVARFLLRHLRPLAEAANRLGRGDHSVRVLEGGTDEVGALAREFNRMATALESRIREVEQTREEEERLREEARVAATLHSVGRALTGTLEQRDVIQAVTDTATQLTGAEVGTFFYEAQDDDGASSTRYTLSGAFAYSDTPAPAPGSFATSVVRIDDALHDDTPESSLRGLPQTEPPVRSYLAVPVRARSGVVLGTLFFGHSLSGMFTEAHETIVTGIAAWAAVALDNARLYAAQRSVAETLQHSLLPERLPSTPGVEMSARYRPGGPGVEVGGDWYDVVELGGGVLGIALGDVVGRGIGAASVMGQIRNAVRAYALDGHQPAALLQRVNTLQEGHGPEQLATMLYGELHLDSGRFRFASAGHPPPLLIDAEGKATFLEEARGVPLGATAYPRFDECTTTLPPGSTLFLYTDGLVERRRWTLDEGLDRLRRAALGASGDVEQVASHVLKSMTADGSADDDIALLVVRAPVLGNPLHLRVESRPSVLASVRALLRRWLSGAGFDEQEAYEIVTACGEACANAIIHGSRSSADTFVLIAEHTRDELRIVVRDDGAWRSRQRSLGGRGLEIMRAFMDDVDVKPGASGTEVRMTKRTTAKVP